jgi:hypothetical protein
MPVPQVTALMASKVDLERRLTILTSMSVPPHDQESKMEYEYAFNGAAETDIESRFGGWPF